MTNSQVNTTQSEFEFSALSEARNYRAALINAFRGSLGGNLLEVGAGIGQFSKELRAIECVKRHLAVEPDARFLPELSKNVPMADIVVGTAQDIGKSDGWDSLVSINVLEHIENDIGELKLYRELLSARKGKLCLFVPARPEIYAPIDKDFGHFRRYTKPGLTSLLREAGFGRIEIKYYNFIGYFAWWLNFRILQKRAFSVPAVRSYDRFIFPITAFVERFIRPPFGQNLVVIAHAG